MSDVALLPNVSFPPDSLCWLNQTGWNGDSFTAATRACSLDQPNPTTAMINFLNLTSDYNSFYQAYCQSPPSDDSCAYGYCPNSDVAGILVRLSIYISSFCLGILIWFSNEKDEITEAFWSQTLTLYSILVSAAISVSKTNLTKFHAIIASELVMSPLTIYMAVYSIRTMFGNRHRMDQVLGKGHLLKQMISLGTVAIWLAFYIFTLLPSDVHQFSQPTCDDRNEFVKLSFLTPLVLIFGAVESHMLGFIAVLIAPLLAIAATWGIAIYLRRRQLWYIANGTVRRTPGFWHVWHMMGTDYPFIHFISVIIVPFLLWIISIEFGISGTADNHFQASFGQILAVFVTVPPLISCAKLIPRFGRWFVDLAWVRLVTRRPQRESFARRTGHDDELEDSGAIPLSLNVDGNMAPTYVAVSRKGSFESRRASFDSLHKSSVSR